MEKCLSLLMIVAMTLFAACSGEDDNTKTVYTVTFETDGGTPAPSDQKVEEGGTVTAPSVNPTKAGYVFVYWHVSGATTAYNFQTPVSRDMTLYAKWQEEAQAQYWQVTWELNGGVWPSDANPANEVLKGGTLTEPAVPTQSNNTFEGWYKDAALTDQVTFPYDVTGETGDITLYAKWQEEVQPEYWQVTWELNGGVWPSDANPTNEVLKDGTLAEPAVPTLPGNILEGWYKDAALTDQVTFPYDVTGETGDITLYAKWEDASKAEYFGTWRHVMENGWQQFTISADKIVWMDNEGCGFTISGLTWTAIDNPGRLPTDDYPIDYRITGTLTAMNRYSVPKADGSGQCAVGDIALTSYYLYAGRSTIGVGNFDTAEQELRYGPYHKKSDVEYWQVTWNLNGGTWPADDNHATQVAKDGQLAAPASPTKAGNNFGGWYKDSSLANRITFPYNISSVKGDFTIYAKWDETAPTVTLKITVVPSAGFHTSISIMRVSSGSPSQYSVPTSHGTHTVNVSPGTYRIYHSYWACPTVNCMSSGYSGNFTVSSGQTKNITISGSSVGL
jgi:uncharacterized repeat protein (TIGR02543 family)